MFGLQQALHLPSNARISSGFTSVLTLLFMSVIIRIVYVIYPLLSTYNNLRKISFSTKRLIFYIKNLYQYLPPNDRDRCMPRSARFSSSLTYLDLHDMILPELNVLCFLFLKNERELIKFSLFLCRPNLSCLRS